MPKVSVLAGGGPNVRPVGTPYQNTRFANPGAEIAQGLGNVAQGVNAAGDALGAAQKELDDVRTDEALLELEKSANTRLYDSKTGFMNQLGINAANTGGPLNDISKSKEKLLNGLQTERQRMRFEKLAGQRVESWRLSMEKHAGDQFMRHVGTLAEGAKLQAETEALNAPDLDTADAAVERAIISDKETGEAGPLRRLLLKQGLPSDQVELRENQYRADVYGKAINAKLAAGDVAGAKAAYDKWGKKITDPRIRKDVQDAFDSVETETAVTAVIGDSMVKSDDEKTTYPWIDEAAAIAKIDEKYPPGPKRDEAKKRLDYRVRENKALQKQAGFDRADQAVAEYYASGKRLDSAKMIPIRNWLLDPKNGATEHWKSLERGDFNDRMQSRQARDRSDQEAIADFLAKPITEQAEANIEVTYVGSSSKMARDKMRAVQNTVRERIKKGLAFTDEDFKAKMDVVAKGTPGMKSTKSKQEAFKGRMINWRLQFFHDNKRDPSMEETEAELKRALDWGDASGDSGGSMWDTNMFRFEAEAKGQKFGAFPADEQVYAPNRVAGAPAAAAPAPTAPTTAPAAMVDIPGLGSMPKADYVRIQGRLKAEGKPPKNHRVIFEAFASEQGAK